MRLSITVCRSVLALAAIAAIAPVSLAQQSSPPVLLQWFESPWKTMERRSADVFAAGYGAVWTPPPGRANYLSVGGGIGYDPYDRFDLGKARDATIYGTENSYKSMIKQLQRTGGSVYVDYVHHHVGSFDLALNGYTYPSSLANQGAPYLHDRSDYPGFELSDPYNAPGSPFARDTYAALNSGQPSQPAYEYWFRLGDNLVTIDLTSGRSFVRNPVPGNAQNVRQASGAWAIPTAKLLANGQVGADTKTRQANTPDANNARFYPDLATPGRTIIDHGVSYTVHDFNNATPLAGDAVPETTVGYMMRYAQWLTQSVGVDGIRIDAARHVPLGVYDSTWNPNSLNVPELIDRSVAGASNRTNLDGTKRSVFQFQEIFNYDASFLKGFVRKSQPSGDTVNPNRDVLDFSMWKAMAQNMTSNGAANDWFQIRSASVNASVYNTLDPNTANNGDNGIGFVYNHDEGISPPGTGGTIALDNVAHAWILMRPGNAYVYYRGNEFDRSNNGNFFLKQGRGDALGGQYGSIITTLLDVRNSYGRGNFIERYIDNAGPNNERLANSAIYVFERQGSAIVGLNIGYNPGATTRVVQTSFVAGTHLEEVTGNWQDASGQVPRTVTVDANGKANIAIPWNNGTNGSKGYVVYGLPRPRGTMSLSNVTQVLTDPAPTPATNGTARITALNVVTGNSFNVTLNTNAVTLSDGFRDTYADGDAARFKIDDGTDVNGNGTFDNPSSLYTNTTKYGFESFLTTNTPGYGSGTGNGTYSQSINAANLSEGYHYITGRAWRHQGVNESEVYTDFKKVVYVDRLAPVSAVDSTGQMPYQSDDKVRDIRVKSTDGTADNMHIFFDLPASLTQTDILNLVAGGTGQGDWVDSGTWGKQITNVGSGNHVITAVTYEITGNKSIQRFVGNYIGTTRGAGLGDVDYSGAYATNDVGSFETVLYSQNTQFNAAGDINGDGFVDNLDLYSLPARYTIAGASAPVIQAAKDAIKRRGDFTGNYTTAANAADVDNFYQNLGSTNWKYDLDANGTASNINDLDILIHTILNTEYGDANVDGRINTIDFNNLAGNFALPAGALWTQGDFNTDRKIDSIDFNLLVLHYGYIAPASAPTTLGAIVPEPASVPILLGVALILPRRGRAAANATGALIN